MCFDYKSGEEGKSVSTLCTAQLYYNDAVPLRLFSSAVTISSLVEQIFNNSIDSNLLLS